MNHDEIVAGLREAANLLPDGRVRSERLELLASAAKVLDDRALECRVLLELSRAYGFGGERDRQPLVFARLLKILDEFPAEVGELSQSIHWQLKWMTSVLVDSPDVPVPMANRWLEEMESRYRQRGYSPRPVHALRSDLAMGRGDTVAAVAAMDDSIAAPRDRMADCEACERNAWGVLRAELGDDEGALEHWEPILNGQRQCAEEPHRALARALLPLVRLGRLDEARSAYLKGYSLARRNINLCAAIGRHIEFCALTGNEARGLEILAEHATWLAEPTESVTQWYAFCSGIAVLLRRLVVLGHGDVPVGTDTAAGVLADLEKQLTDTAARWDRRYGNSHVSEQLAERLGRQPLVDWLPLGISASLPQGKATATAPATAPATASSAASPAAAGPADTGAEPWEVLRQDAIRAEKILRDGDPAAAEELIREILRRGGRILPQRAAAQLYTLLGETLHQQPERELDLVDAALKASARWDGVSEPDMLHQRFIAAMAYQRLDRHVESAALFEDVIARVDVPYDRLGAARARRSYGESLRALRRHRDAAEQLLQVAAVLQGDADNVQAYAEVAWAAAESLRMSGQQKEALVAYERAAGLWEALGAVTPWVRCRRSMAWLLSWEEPERAVALMREVLAKMQEWPEQGDEWSAEQAETVDQLGQMVQEAEVRARAEAEEEAGDDKASGASEDLGDSDDED